MNAAHNPDRPQPLLLLAIALIGVFAFLQVYSVQAVLPILMHDLQASEVQVGLAVGATVMGVALMSPFMGMLSDALGRKVFIVGSLLFLGIPTALLAGAQSIEAMMFYRFLQGLAVPGSTVVLIAYVGEEFGGKAKEALGKATDNDKLVAEGKADQAVADVKQAGEKAKDAFK